MAIKMKEDEVSEALMEIYKGVQLRERILVVHLAYVILPLGKFERFLKIAAEER